MSSFGHSVGHNFFFSDTLESDSRQPCLIFNMPKIILQILHMEDDGEENKFGILLPYLEFWIAMVMVRGYDVIVPSSSICLCIHISHIYIYISSTLLTHHKMCFTLQYNLWLYADTLFSTHIICSLLTS